MKIFTIASLIAALVLNKAEATFYSQGHAYGHSQPHNYIRGKDNDVKGRNNVVIGHGNQNRGYDNTMVGDQNVVYGRQNYIQG